MNRRSIPKHRRKPLPQRRSAVSSNSVCIRNVPQRSAPSPRRRRPRPLLRGSDCARSQAAVPAVSMARRRIERLQGVQFCRRAMEIRSEVSGPPDCVRGAWTEKRGVCAPLDFWFGRAGVMGEGSGHFFHAFSSHSGSSPGGLCPHPPRNLRFLGFSFCCRLFGRTDLPFWGIGASRDHRGAAPSLRNLFALETQTQRSSRHHGGAHRVA